MTEISRYNSICKGVMTMDHSTGPPGIASGQEILEFLTGVMRGDADGSTQTMKAAELLGKRMGLFAEKIEPPPAPVIIDDISDDG